MKRLLLLLSLVASPLVYADSAYVVAVRMPAWGEHDGVKTALVTGSRLENSDSVSTGSGGRILLKLEDETSIKLGENSKLVLDNLSSAHGTNSSYRAAISVPNGTIRVITKPLYQPSASEKDNKKHSKNKKKSVKSKAPRIDLRQHELNIHAGSVTAVTAGIDVVGKAGDERDVIALLKGGSVDVSHDDASRAVLSRSGSFVEALKPGSLNAPSKIGAHDISSLKAATDLIAGRGITSSNGRWKVSVGTYRDLSEAESWQGKLGEEGYAAEVANTAIGGKTYARLQIPQLKSRQDAAVVAEKVRQQFDLDKVSVIRKVEPN